MAVVRLQRILAQSGVASRRGAEVLIVEGRVRVNGRVVRELGTKADPRKDRIEVHGKRLVLEKPVYYLFHKPRKMVTTLSDPEGRTHLGEVVSQMNARAFPVGRLDYHTSGALLLTNDGILAEALLNPRKRIPKVYVAKMKGHLSEEALGALRNGVVLEDGERTRSAEVVVLREEPSVSWVQFTLYQGKNRQIHRMGDAVGHPVMRLARLSFAGLTTSGLRPGQFRALTEKEVDQLRKSTR